MKICPMIRFFGMVYGSMVKSPLIPKETRKRIMKEYYQVMDRAGDIGSDNNLLGSYTLAAMFVATIRETGLSAEACASIIEAGMRKSRLFKAAMGNADSYLSEKKMAGRREWAKRTHEHVYEDDWVVDIIEKDDKYDLGYDYLECGAVKLMKKEGMGEYTKYLCRFDYFLFEMIGLKLERTGTIAEGAPKCDFRMKRP